MRRLRPEQGLRLRLRLADELTAIPWEYVYLQDAHGERTSSGFLALHPRISMTRYEALAVPGDWFEAPSERRIVVAMASPEPHAVYPELKGLPEEHRLLRETLGASAEFVPKTFVRGSAGATLNALRAALMGSTDVFHFSGHGDFTTTLGPALGSRIGEGSIVLADENNRALSVSADRLGELLRGRGIRLVVLGACQTGSRDGRNVWSGVAASLLKAEIPAVVAMQFTVNDDLAVAFNGAFYQALIAGLTVDEAVTEGRLAIRSAAQGDKHFVRDWGAPVLYLRSPGGAVFPPCPR
jgi:CHAT domain-containing protein